MSKDSGSSGPDEGGDPRSRLTGLSPSSSPPPLFTDEEIAEMSQGLTSEELKDSINQAARAAVEKDMKAAREQHDIEMNILRDQLAALLVPIVDTVPDIQSSLTDPLRPTVPAVTFSPLPPLSALSSPPSTISLQLPSCRAH